MVEALSHQQRYQVQKQEHQAFPLGPKHAELKVRGKEQIEMKEKEREYDG
jgi:hypothetical protein